jgi:hypothetical protein
VELRPGSPTTSHACDVSHSASPTSTRSWSRVPVWRCQTHRVNEVLSALTLLNAVVVSVVGVRAYREGKAIQKEALKDRQRAVARLVTGWWTRVGADGEDLSDKDFGGASWPDQTGFRIWVLNGSDECIYGCRVVTEVEPGPGADPNGITRVPFGFLNGRMLVISPEVVAPGQRLPILLDRELATSVGVLSIQFRDAAGRYWKRTAGYLREDTEPDRFELPRSDMTDH